MSKDSSEEGINFQEHLRALLKAKKTDKVYKLHKLYPLEVNFEEFTIIGISNITGEWSENVQKAVQAFMSENPGVYYLPLNSIDQVQDDSFIKHFSGLINPGADDSFPRNKRKFKLKDLDPKRMLNKEYLYQAIIDQSSKFKIPYLGICSGSQHLVLNNQGYLRQIDGYTSKIHRAEFIYGTIPYFMTLNQQEQELALTQCVMPKVSFAIATAHDYAAVGDDLGGVTLAATSEEGIVESHSKGTTQIGVQFHPENYYFETTYSMNRQKQFLDNFFKLAQRHNAILNYAREHQLSEQEIHDRMNVYDLAILSSLQNCAARRVNPSPIQGIFMLMNSYMNVYPTNLSKRDFDQIIEGKIERIIDTIDFNDQKLKNAVIKVIEDRDILKKFLELDNHSVELRKLFIEFEDEMHNPSLNFEHISAKYSAIFEENSSLSSYGLIRAIKNNQFEIASEIIQKNPQLISSEFFQQYSKDIRWGLVDSLELKSYTTQALKVIKSIATIEQALSEAIKEKKEEEFKAIFTKLTLVHDFEKAISDNNQEALNHLLPKINEQEILGNALEIATTHNNQEMFDKIFERITDQEQIDKAFENYFNYAKGNRPNYGFRQQDLTIELLKDFSTNGQIGISYIGESDIKQDNFGDFKIFKRLLSRASDQTKLNTAFVWASIYNFKKEFAQLLPKITDQKLLGNTLNIVVNRNHPVHNPTMSLFEQLLVKINDKSYLTEALDIAKTKGEHRMFRLIEERIREISPPSQAQIDHSSQSHSPGVFKSINDLAKKYDPFKILGGAEATSIDYNLDHSAAAYRYISPVSLPRTKDLSLSNHTSIPENHDMITAPSISQRPTLGDGYTAQEIIPKVAAAGIVAAGLYKSGKKLLSSTKTRDNLETASLDKKLQALYDQFKQLHDKRLEKYKTSPSTKLLEEIKHFNSLKEQTLDVLGRLEKLNKGKKGKKKDLRQEAREIWKKYKELDKEKFDNAKNITQAIAAARELRKSGFTESESNSPLPSSIKDANLER